MKILWETAEGIDLFYGQIIEILPTFGHSIIVYAIKIPTEVLLGLREEKTEFEDYTRKLLAFNLYEKRRLSLGLCTQVAQLPKEDFIALLSENKISIFSFSHYR